MDIHLSCVPFSHLGQVSSVAVASAVFQSRLDAELRQRIHVPGADKVISEIRHSLTLVGSLLSDLQRVARDAYSASLRTVFIVAIHTMLIAYVVRLPVSLV
ncbi:hypothetical protein J3R82DRAFT_1659 [Butyriboletus roseoflavus]|nr:hypothetical protein J3R82DRAFT_1659 [Butyriboletus roseoflavus]